LKDKLDTKINHKRKINYTRKHLSMSKSYTSNIKVASYKVETNWSNWCSLLL